MQNTRLTEVGSPLAFQSKLEGRPGGITVAVSDLTQLGVPAGTPVGKGANGLFNVIKCAKLTGNAGNAATGYPVAKGHNFKVGDFISPGVGSTAYAITSIDTSNAGYDTLNVGTTLGVALNTGDILVQAAAQSATNTSALKYVPYGLTGTAFDVIQGGNHFTDCVVRGTAVEANIPPIHKDVKAKLPLIRFE